LQSIEGRCPKTRKWPLMKNVYRRTVRAGVIGTLVFIPAGTISRDGHFLRRLS
jgi:hypothetical protein